MDATAALIAIPVVTGLIGWFTNWAAVKMIFYPERFVGLGPLGWRGILPRNARAFARSVSETLTGQLLSARDLAERLRPADVERVLASVVDEHMDIIARRAAEALQPGAWDLLPPEVRQRIASELRIEIKSITAQIFDRMQGISDEILDLKSLIVAELSGENTSKLVRLFQQIGARELRFIEYYGGVFGLLIGLVQVAAWSVFQTWWLMPIVGVFTGLVTNWLALQMIFRPMEPKRYLLLFRYQGLFPKRQAQIAADYGRMAADEILTPRNLVRLVTEGEGGARIASVVTEILHESIESASERAHRESNVEVTPEMRRRVKKVVVRELTAAVPMIVPQVESYLERTLDVAKTVEGRLARLPKPAFERILRGLFERDEGILIVIGGVLGALVGFGQGALVLALGQ